MTVKLVCDVLDQAVFDRDGQPMGRVDGNVLELRDGAPPRVASIVIGPTALGQRLHPLIGRWVAAIEEACGLERERPVEIGASGMRIADDGVRVAAAIGETGAAIVEQRLRAWLRRLPGAG
jgi:hypothetical protein